MNTSKRVGILGLGYVGLPLAMEMVRAGYQVIGFDLSDAVTARLMRGESHVQDVSDEALQKALHEGRFEATTDMSRLAGCEAVSICVPTPLNKIKDPDLSYVVAAVHTVLASLQGGMTVVLESTTYPGTTREVVLPLLEQSGLQVGRDFFLCFSPERVDPGNPTWNTRNIPKVIGGVTSACLERGLSLYGPIFETLVPVSSAEAAELTKVYENTFRMVGIALANELAQVCDRLGVNVWEVVEAAATKPFGFMKFTPGPGLGGHCIPLDPHYLSWKMRTLSFKTRLIELASEINADMPRFVVQKVGDALNDVSKAVKGSHILVLGVAYKRGVADLRESPAIEVMRLLQSKGAVLSYYDPHVPSIEDDGHTPLVGLPMKSLERLEAAAIQEADVVLIITDHGEVNYEAVASGTALVVDTRGVMRSYPGSARVIALSGE